MDEPLHQDTEFLVLRLTPYQDYAVILGGISPQYGRMSFYWRRPAGTRRNFACVDLFRVVQVSWRRGNRDICHADEISPVADYGALCRHPAGYMAACEIARFALDNVLPGCAMPEFFQALRVAFVRLADGRLAADALKTCVGLVFLNEGGWMSSVQLDPASAAQCELLLRMAAGGDIPALTDENWRQLWNWTVGRLLAAECKVC